MFSTVVLLQVRLPSSNSWSKIRVDSPGQLDGVIVDLPLLHTQVVVGQLLHGGHLWGICLPSATGRRQDRIEKETTTWLGTSQQSLRLRTVGPLPVARVQITCCQPSSPNYEIQIFMGVSKSFGTHITEKPPRQLVRILFWSRIGSKGPKMPIIGRFWA